MYDVKNVLIFHSDLSGVRNWKSSRMFYLSSYDVEVEIICSSARFQAEVGLELLGMKYINRSSHSSCVLDNR